LLDDCVRQALAVGLATVVGQGDRTPACLDHLHDVLAAASEGPAILLKELDRTSLAEQPRHVREGTGDPPQFRESASN
jgi:hypothetical protein